MHPFQAEIRGNQGLMSGGQAQYGAIVPNPPKQGGNPGMSIRPLNSVLSPGPNGWTGSLRLAQNSRD